MATGFDELMEQLLYDVALSGSRGLGAEELEQAVKAFYEAHQQQNQTNQPDEDDLLFSDTPPVRATVIDEAFIETVWAWLEAHPDIRIESHDDDNEANHAGPRVFTNDERAWQVVAGHGIDFSRIPRLMFDLLSLIAAHGPKGIFQPALVRISGQDKRSVPKRTDSLAENGYIVKLSAYDGKHRTSLLKLRRFAETDGTPKEISKLERTRMHSRNEVLDSPGPVWTDETFDEIINIFNTNDNIVAIVDLCTAFKLRKNTIMKKDFLLCLNKLEQTGCARKVKALLSNSNNRYATCLQLMRDPTDQDRAAFKGELDEEDDRQLNGGEDGNETQGVDGEDAESDEEQGETSQTIERIPPQWTPDTLPNNLIFNIIENAGPAGISSMELHKRSMGPFWKKSLDELLLRLTDVWQVSQPPHLRHLSVIRDTGVESRSSHFHFRTRRNFEEAVEMGLTAWEAILDSAHDGSKKKLGRPTKPQTAPDVDEFGFPTLDPSRFADKEGRASLAQCAEPARKSLMREAMADDSPVKKRGRPSNKKSTCTLATPPLAATTATPSEPTAPGSNVTPKVMSVGEKQRPTLATGRRQRKDAGIRKGPRGKRKSFLDLEEEAGEPSNDQMADSSGVDTLEMDAEMSSCGTTNLSTEKRTATAAQLDESPQARKLQRTCGDAAAPQDMDVDTSELGETRLPGAGDNTNLDSSTNFRIQFDSAEALKARFQNYKRPGRRPATKIMVFYSKRLMDLQSFNPSGLRSERLPEQETQDVGTVGPLSEPPRKRARLDANSAPISRVQDPTDSVVQEMSSPSPPKRKRGRPPKQRPVQIAATPLRNSVSATTVDDSATNKQNMSTAQAESAPSRIVKLPLPRDKLREILGHDIAASSADTELDSSRLGVTGETQSTAETEPSERSPSVAAPNLLPSEPTAGALSGFSRNIHRPYLTSIVQTDASKLAEDENTQPIDSSTVTEPEGLEDPSTFDGLPELVPAEVDDEDGYREKVYRKVGTPRRGGIIQLRRSKIILDTMRKADGVFPGDHEMWYPYTTAWQTTYTHLPDRRTVDNTVNMLVKQNKLNKYSFQFPDKSGKMVQRHIITEADVSISSSKVKRVQKAIIDAYPFRYLPRQVHIAKHLRDKARQVPVTQGGRRNEDDDDIPKGDFPAYIPMGSRLSGSSARFTGSSRFISATPVAPKAASFTPRAIRRIKGQEKPAVVEVEQDYIDTESDSDDDDDEEDFDEQSLEIETEQAALQSSFAVDRYSHSEAGTPIYKGKRPLRSLKVGGKVLQVLPPLTPTLALPPKHEIFHSPSGTFGTAFIEPLRAKRPGRPGRFDPLITPKTLSRPAALAADKKDPARAFVRSKPKKSTPGSEYPIPESVDDILTRANALGCQAADPSEPRFYQFENEVDRVNAWERAMAVSGRTMETPFEFVFLNFSLKQPHVVNDNPADHFNFEFVEGTLKPFNLELDRQKQSRQRQKRRKTSDGHGMGPRMTSLDSPYEPPRASATPTYSGSTQSSASQPLQIYSSGGTFQPKPAPRSSNAQKAKRPYTYRSQRKAKADQIPPSNSLGTTYSATEHATNAPKRSSAKARKFTPEEYKQLAMAVAVARIICGGTAPGIVTNYDAVALGLGSKYDVEMVKYQWQNPRKVFYNVEWVKKVEHAMREPFLEAYAKDALPEVDFDDLQNTDWAGLVRWVENKIVPTLEEGKPLDQLPTDRQCIEIADGRTMDGFQANTQQAASSLDGLNASSIDSTRNTDQHHMLEKSWIRAVMIPSDDDYDADAAADRLRPIDADLLSKLTKEMVSTKMIAGGVRNRYLPGRSFRISQHAMSQFERWTNTSDGLGLLRDVAAARAHFVDCFRENDQLEIGSDITEAQLIALTNMVTQGHLRMFPALPGRNDDFNAAGPTLSKWGPIDRLHDPDQQQDIPAPKFKVVYKKTPLFTSDHQLKLDVPIPDAPSPFPGESGQRSPFWIGVKGEVEEKLWRMVLQSIIHLLVHTPGCTAKAIERAHDSKLWEWEIDIVLAWMEEVGVAVRVGSGKDVGGVWKGGWRASEWWYCVFSSEETSAEAVGGAEADAA